MINLKSFLFLISCVLFFACGSTKQVVKENPGTPTANSKLEVIHYFDKYDKCVVDNLIEETRAASKVPVLYFYADWCGPCRVFKKSLGNNLVKESLNNTVLIKINVDVDHCGLTENYGINMIPTFVKTDGNGKTIAEITSAAWSNDSPKSIAAVLEQFVSGTKYDRSN